jgi:hypothetical protein
MKRVFAIVAGLSAFAVLPLYADYTVTHRGTWPESWPKELESLRKNSRTFEGPLQPLLHYGIRFTTREEFEAAWPHLLKVKSNGAPIVLRRGPNFWLDGASQGVCVHTPPADTKPLSAADVKNSRWETTNYIELIVDGTIVDLNRIFLPADTPIIDERFKEAITTR